MDGGQGREFFFLAVHRRIPDRSGGSETAAEASSGDSVDAYERFWIATYNYSLVLVFTYCFTALQISTTTRPNLPFT
jgi:hypothetical protein